MFFRVDASRVCAGAMRVCLASGARRVGFDVCAGGVNGGLASREMEVRGLWSPRVFGFVACEACGACVVFKRRPQLGGFGCGAGCFVVLVVGCDSYVLCFSVHAAVIACPFLIVSAAWGVSSSSTCLCSSLM